MSLDSKDRDAIIRRLRRIEGQVKGVQKMVEEGKYCGDILVQVAAIRSAMNSVGGLILEDHIKDCLKRYIEGETQDEKLEALIETMIKYTKQN